MSKKAFEAWYSPTLFEEGLGTVVVSREKTSGTGGVITAGVFLVDMYCLGVKDAYMRHFPAYGWEEVLEEIFGFGKESMSPACARKLIEGAVAYARSFGFHPHPDYEQANHVLSGIDASQCETVFTYGKDGQPLFIPGPNDTPETMWRTVAALSRAQGGSAAE